MSISERDEQENELILKMYKMKTERDERLKRWREIFCSELHINCVTPIQHNKTANRATIEK